MIRRAGNSTIRQLLLWTWIFAFLGISFEISQHHHLNQHEKESCSIHALGLHLAPALDIPPTPVLISPLESQIVWPSQPILVFKVPFASLARSPPLNIM